MMSSFVTRNFVAFYFFALVSSAFGQQQVNLLTDGNPKLVAQYGIEIGNEHALRDGNHSTTVTLQTGAEQLDLVYGFGDQTVTVREFSIMTVGLAANSVSVEILASTLSATEGYQSLRSEPLKATAGNPQAIRFVDSAAKWIMIRFVPVRPNSKIVVADFSLAGHVGQPKTIYKFDESPADAIKVLSELSQSVKVEMSKDESAMFEDAKDGKFDDISFAEASLLSSGVYDVKKRRQYLKQIDELAKQSSSNTSSSQSDFEKGQKLLDLLHNGPFRSGYQEKQTDVSTVLENQSFNCVSSATLYNILARRLGLDVRAIEVPDHAFSILYDGTDHVDIETTNRLGFNPARNKNALEQFQRQTGFVYIPDRNRANRREIGETGLVAITYYNHGVDFTRKKQFNQALICYFKALSLDPKNKSAVKNILVTLSNWSAALASKGDYSHAIDVLGTGLELAPDDWRLKSNNLAVWQRYVRSQVAEGKAADVLARLKSATQKTNSHDLAKLQSWVFLTEAEKLVKKSDWKEGIALAENGFDQVDEIAQREISDWKTSAVMRWSQSHFKENQFEEAVEVLAAELEKDTGVSRYRLENRLAYTVHHWADHVKKVNDVEAANELLNRMTKRFPNVQKVQSASNGFTDAAVAKLLKENDFEGALKLYAAARKERPDDYHLKKNETSVWVSMARTSMTSRDWQQAIKIYQRAIEARPDEHVLKQNATYIVQEWSREIAKAEGLAAGEKIVSEWASKFPSVYKIKQMGGNLVSVEIRKLVDAKEFDNAEAILYENRSAFLQPHDLQKRATYVYFQHAAEFRENKDWENVINVFESGLKLYPDNRDIEKNLLHAWNSWASEFMDNEEWAAALKIYKKALQSVPNHSTLKNNLRYCESKLKPEGEDKK